MARPGLVTLLAVLHFISASVLLLVPLAAFKSIHDADPIATTIGVIFLLWGLLALVTGIALWRMRQLGRILQIGFSALGLLAFPIGTLISVFLLIYFTKPGTKILFSGKRIDELTPEETAAVRDVEANSGPTLALAALGGLAMLLIAGILASIAIPNLLTAAQYAKQRRTMAEMKTVQAGIESYRASHGALPETPKIGTDAWGEPLRYVRDGDNYWIVSAGRDGVFETDTPQEYAPATTSNVDADLVIRNGEWLRKPNR